MNIDNIDTIHQQDSTSNRQEQQQEQERKKCHGNRKDQRFRRKCRARGIKPAIIKKLLNKRKHNKKKQKKNNKGNRAINNTHNQMATSTASNNVSTIQLNVQSQHTTTTRIDTNKRKRDYLSQQEQNIHQTIPKSTSLVSFEPPLSKKMKEKQATIIIPSIQVDNKRINTNYRFVCFLYIHNSCT
jgi:hypothetical protein